MAMKMDEVTGGAFKVGGITYNMVEAKYNGIVVWPSGQPVVITTYEVVASSVYYIFSNGGSYLLATGGNYASAYGTVLVKENGTTVETLYNTRLDVHLPSGSPFYINNNYIFGYNLGTTPYPNGLSSSVNVSYLSSSLVSASTQMTQEENVVESTRTIQGTTVYDYENAEYQYDYTLAFDANRYDSASSKCPAYGGSATLSLSAYHFVESWIPWTRTDTIVETYTSETEKRTPSVVSDTEHSYNRVDDTATITGSATGFTRNNLAVSIASYATQSQGWDTGRSVTYTAKVLKYDNTYLTETVTIYQDADSIDHTAPVTTREWTSQPSTAYSEYSVSMTIAKYTSPSSPASAGNDSTGFGVSGSHREITTRNYTDVTVTTTYWVSGRETTGTPSTQSGTATISDEVITTDVPVVTFSYETGHGSGWLTKNTSTLTIASEGTDSYTNGSTYGRRGKVTAANGTATQELYVYQARNVGTLEYDYNLAVSIIGDRTIPASQTQIGVSYTCQERTRTTYTSGSSTAWSSYSSVTPTISTVPSGLTIGNLTSSAFTVDLGTYTTQADRQITVTISRGTATPVSDTITQEAYVPTVQKVATLMPQMFTVNTGPYLKGKVYYLFTIESGSLWQGTLTGLNFCYRVNGGTKQTVQIGSFYIEETSQPTALEPSGVTIPTFSSGTVKSWFEVTGSKGGFDTINAGEDYAYTVTF